MSKAFSNWTHPEKKERIKLKDRTHKTRRNKSEEGPLKPLCYQFSRRIMFNFLLNVFQIFICCAVSSS